MISIGHLYNVKVCNYIFMLVYFHSLKEFEQKQVAKESKSTLCWATPSDQPLSLQVHSIYSGSKVNSLPFPNKVACSVFGQGNINFPFFIFQFIGNG